MFDRVLNMSQILNMPAFWIYGGPEYTRLVNMSGFWICFWFWICQGSGYTMVLNMTGLHSVLNMTEYVWIIPGNAWLCLISAALSQPSVLDMKWENLDINVVEWANIPKIPPLLNGDYEKILFCGWWNT